MTSGAVELDRREALKVMAATLGAAGLAACGRPPEQEIVPYVDPPEGLVPGRAQAYASALTEGGLGGGLATGVLVTAREGRPVKVEGNPDHPASLGATGVYAQAALYRLYDPDRSRAPLERGRIRSWAAFVSALAERRERWRQSGGRGLRVLTPEVASPTYAALVDRILERYPQAAWHRHEPVHRDAAVEGARLAFGEEVATRYRIDRAAVVLDLGGDFLSDVPGRLRYARELARRRRPSAQMLRLYAVESVPGLSGAMADHRLAVPALRVDHLARALAQALGVDVAAPEIPAAEARWLRALADDLERHAPAALVIPGEFQAPGVHALAHAINARLGAGGVTAVHTDPVVHGRGPQRGSIRELAEAARAGEVRDLVILGGNPAYDAPADLAFRSALAAVPFSVHLGEHVDETALACRWHLPATHELEAWGDARAYDGTVTIQQPLLRPLHRGRSPLAVLAHLLGELDPSDHALVRAGWVARHGEDDFEAFWRGALRAGVVPGSEAPARPLRPRPDLAVHLGPPPAPAPGPSVQFRPDPGVFDGRHANNAWLQELPRPMTQLVWGNAVLASPADAERLGLGAGDVIRVERGGRGVEGPLWVAPGHAEGAFTLLLGYGRTAGAPLAAGLGYDAYRLRTSEAPWTAAVTVTAAGGRSPPVSAQDHHRMHGRHLVRHAELRRFLADPRFLADDPHAHPPAESLYPEPRPERSGGPGAYAWGMSVDLNACIGCGACTIACQAENNIPVVGPAEVARGREMHWIRVDRYVTGPATDPRTFFQPVPCMHCENAPCEYVCPVGATVHDTEGLNVMVYNRCIGTRDCSQNCPYKVRRFNFFDYAYDARSQRLAPARNPEVTVRSRGVMEKCTYCVQRISAARREAKKEDRRIRDGEVVTACQAVCPAEAIVFGDVADPTSRVSEAKAGPLQYTLLPELNTRPRTTYAARIGNPNPVLGRGGGGG